MTAFSPSGAAQVSVTGGLTPVSNPTIFNLDLTIPGTEYSQVIPTGVKRVSVKSRTGAEFRLAYTPGGTSLAWLTIKPGSVYFEVDLVVTTLTVYLQSPTVGSNEVEIVTWS